MRSPHLQYQKKKIHPLKEGKSAPPHSLQHGRDIQLHEAVESAVAYRRVYAAAHLERARSTRDDNDGEALADFSHNARNYRREGWCGSLIAGAPRGSSTYSFPSLASVSWYFFRDCSLSRGGFEETRDVSSELGRRAIIELFKIRGCVSFSITDGFLRYWVH